MTILCISDITSDSHLLPVAAELSRRGHTVRFFNPGRFPETATITVDGTPDGQRTVLSWDDQSLDLSTVERVWYRKPSNLQLDPRITPEEATWLRSQCADLIQGIWANVDAFWVSEPHRLRHASLKLLQLRLARQLGLCVPDYIVTNSPERAHAFIAAHPDGVIVKALAAPTLFSPERFGMIYTHRLTAADLDHLDEVRHEPTFLQAFVPKRVDVRVTVIGDEVFPVAIDSMGTPEAVVDFRRADMMDLPHEPIALPGGLQAACLELVRRLGLQFGAIDLLLTPDDEYVFLEINPNGQWLWIEMMTELPMTRAMCDLLERGATSARTSQPAPARVVAPAAARPKQVLPVGEQVVSLSAHVAEQLGPNGAHALPAMAASRAWIEVDRGSMLLHVGDIDLSDTDHS
jgi:glutathione synthase/RimK-type ligase-like ATP-grasp enzyme